MEELGFTQEELAQKLGITRGAITHYLSGRRVPPLKQFHRLASVLGVDPAWLQFGARVDLTLKNDKSPVRKNVQPHVTQHTIPILTWEQITKQPDLSRINPKEIKAWVHHFYTDQPDWFAMHVKGDSMTSSGQKSFHEGDIIIVKKITNAKHGDFVVAVFPKSKKAIFKQYVIDNGIEYLKPLNRQYPMIELASNYKIVGIVISMISSC